LTGFDCAFFASLCEIFAPIFNSYTLFVPSGKSCFERKKQKNNAGAYNRPIRFFFLADLSYVGFVLVSDFLDISDGKSISLFVSQNKSSPMDLFQ
jgi:hypothetical protein